MHILQAHGRPGRIFGQPALFFCPVHVRFFTDRICLVDPTPQRATWLRAVIRLLVQPYCRRSALLAFLGGTCEGEVCACDVCLRSGGGLQAAAPTRSVTPVQGLAAALAAAAAAVSELASTELVCAPEVVDGRAAAIMLLSALESEIGSGSGQPTVRQLLTKQERLLQSQLFQSRTNYAALVLTLIGEGLLSLELSPRLKGKGSTARVAPASSWREQLVIVSRPLLVTVLREHSEPPQAAAAAAAAAQGPRTRRPLLASAPRSSSSRSGRRCACNRMHKSMHRRFFGSCCASVRGRVYRHRRSRTERWCSASGRRDACRSMRRRRWRCLTRGRRSRPSGPSPPGCARRVSSRSSMAALHAAAAQGDHSGLALWTMVSRLGQTDIWALATGPAGKSYARDAHPMYQLCGRSI